MYLLAIDPGCVSGLVHILYSTGLLYIQEAVEIEGLIDTLKYVQSVQAQLYIVESFKLRRDILVVDSDMTTSQIIGALKWELRDQELVFQPPIKQSDKVKTLTKQLGYHIKGKKHCRSAMAHVISYMLSTGKDLRPWKKK